MEIFLNLIFSGAQNTFFLEKTTVAYFAAIRKKGLIKRN
jgi:hypothetical protein